MEPITVVIPVGPEFKHAQYLTEAIESVARQVRAPAELILIDDMASLSDAGSIEANGRQMGLDMPPVRVWRNPWRMGIGASFNAGVGLSQTEYVLMLGADDLLFPEAVWRAGEAVEGTNPLLFWFLGVQYSDGRPDQQQPCNACVVSKTLWKYSGGFPPAAESGAMDAALGSIILGNPAAFPGFLPIDVNRPLYWHRVHPDQETARLGAWQGVIIETRNILTAEWRPPTDETRWGRYEP